MPGPRSGPCNPWCAAADIQGLPWVQAAQTAAVQKGSLTAQQVTAICAQAATASSEILYELSGRMFTGSGCGPVTIRPVSRPTDIDTRSLAGLGWFSVAGWGGYGSAMGYGQSGVSVHYGTVEPPTIHLPFPVDAITLVKIDGVVIPATEYELRGHQELVRLRPTQSFSPTDRWGWPTSQIMDLADTEPGTFSVTFTFGVDPPSAGKLAAMKLGEYLALPQLGDSSKYPRRTTQVSRQGVTAQTTDVKDILSSGSLGIYEVDAFLLAVNPKKLARQSIAWSPDVGRPRRTANPTTS